MLAAVEQDVDEDAPHFGRRLQDAAVVSIAKDAALSLDHSIQREGDSREEELHAACELRLVLGFGHQVEVVMLNRVLEQPNPTRDGSANDVRDHVADALTAKARNVAHASHRHMNGMSLLVLGAW